MLHFSPTAATVVTTAAHRRRLESLRHFTFRFYTWCKCDEQQQPTVVQIYTYEWMWSWTDNWTNTKKKKKKKNKCHVNERDYGFYFFGCLSKFTADKKKHKGDWRVICVVFCCLPNACACQNNNNHSHQWCRWFGVNISFVVVFIWAIELMWQYRQTWYDRIAGNFFFFFSAILLAQMFGDGICRREITDDCFVTFIVSIVHDLILLLVPTTIIILQHAQKILAILNRFL